jgi:moderate conductance mechanosensitive channel
VIVPAAMWHKLFDGPVDYRAALLAVAGTLVAAWLCARLARRLSAAALRAIVKDTLSTASPYVRAPLRILSAAAFILAFAVLLFPAFEMAGLTPRTGVPLHDLFGPGLKILVTIVLAHALVRMTALLARRFEHEMSVGTNLDALERGKRARTLGAVVQNAVTVLVIGIALLMVLAQFGLDITPVLTGAGIAGLAIGFGAQTLVRDIISGFFLILENQVRVGDAAAINGTDGIVEAINLRTIVLRDIEGTVHVFPNGAINTLANRSKDFSYYVVELSVSYYDDSDRIAEAVREVGASLQADPAFGPSILAPIEVLGVDAFSDWSVKMKARIRTMPLKQWEVGRELRRRLIKTFEDRGFAIPFPVPATAAPPVRPAADQ